VKLTSLRGVSTTLVYPERGEDKRGSGLQIRDKFFFIVFKTSDYVFVHITTLPYNYLLVILYAFRLLDIVQ